VLVNCIPRYKIGLSLVQSRSGIDIEIDWLGLSQPEPEFHVCQSLLSFTLARDLIGDQTLDKDPSAGTLQI
jgi:hypothetical protein